MKKRTQLPDLRPVCASILLFAGLFESSALGQFGPPAGGGAGGSVANQLPLTPATSQPGQVTATEQPVPGATTSVNTINPTVQVGGPYTGSASSTATMPFTGKLSLADAVKRGIEYNLGAVGVNLATRQAEGQARVVRSALLPNAWGTLQESVEQVNLRAEGLRFSSPFAGFSIPSIVGPFNFFDLRAHLTQTVADLTALNNYRSAKELVRANEFAVQDSKDLVVLAVGGAYLQVLSAQAKVTSAAAQLEAANSVYQQTVQQKAVGLVTQIDVNKSEVQMLTEKQRVTTLQNDLAKQKINLARLVGIPPNSNYQLSNDVPFAPPPVLNEDDAIMQAFSQRADIKAAQAQITAAQRTLAAARDEWLPALDLSGDYGVIGLNPSQAHGTFSVTGSLRFQLWQGGRTEGDIEEANAALSQRRAELEDTKSRVESDVRNAFLDLQAAASQVDVARQNLDVTRETLTLTRQRFDAGVTDIVDVAQTQAAVAAAELDYINSVFAHNVAKLSLARAIGATADNLPRFLNVR